MYIMKILNKKMFHASLCLFLVTVGVYGGKICVAREGGWACPEGIGSDEGIGAFCSKHIIPFQDCVSGDKQCIVNTDINVKVSVTVTHGECIPTSTGNLICNANKPKPSYLYIRGCYTVE